MVSRWLFVAAVAVIGGAVGAPSVSAFIADFDPFNFQVLLDTDNNSATGCDIAAEDDNFAGPITGIEYIVNAQVQRFPSSATVNAVDLGKCIGGVPVFQGIVDAGDWNVGINNGTGGADVVEFYIPRDAVGHPGQVTLSFHATRVFFNDVLVTTNGTDAGDPIVFQLPSVASVPVFSAGGLALCAFLLAAVAWRATRHRQSAMLVISAFALAASMVTAVWAATIVMDGNIGDWTGILPIATDATFDSSADDDGEDIVTAFVTADGQNIYFRLDQLNLAPVVCGNTSIDVGEDCEHDEDCASLEHCSACQCDPD